MITDPGSDVPPRVAVMGAGAIGTWIGAALTEAGVDTTLVARGAHLQALRRDGAQLVADGDGARTVAVRATDEPAQVGAVDVLILTVKAHDLPAAAPALAPLMHAGTTVVSGQNGIPWWWFHGVDGGYAGRRVTAVDPHGSVAAALPPERALGAVVYLGAALTAPGVVRIAPEAGLVLGEPDATDSPRLREVAGLLQRAGFPVRTTADIRMEIWTKLMGNASFNLMSVLTGAGIGTMAADHATGPVIAALMGEIVGVAAAFGAAPVISIDERIAIASRLGDHKPSTLQDLEAGKRLELDALGGAVVELADLAGAPAPTLRAIFAAVDLRARKLGLR